MTRRPYSLAEVADLAVADPSAFGRLLAELADRFYLGETPGERQACLDPEPRSTGDAITDAWIGAAGEHLAHRWGLRIPDWTRRGMHFALDRAVFQPDNPRINGILFVESPPAFRKRSLFVVAEPLTRARFPADRRSRISLDPPSAIQPTDEATSPSAGR
jgi:hypothetical protein